MNHRYPHREPWTLGLLLSVLTMTQGCGLLWTHGPPTGHGKMYHVDCTVSRIGPILDFVAAGLYAQATIDLNSYAANGEDETSAVIAAVFWTGLYGTSGIVGLGKTSRCREARQQLAERLSAPGPADAVVRTVEIAPAESTLSVGDQLQLAAIALDAAGGKVEGRSFAWSSSNSAVASVSFEGLVTARAPGRVMIAANTGGVVGTTEVRVMDNGTSHQVSTERLR